MKHAHDIHEGIWTYTGWLSIEVPNWVGRSGEKLEELSRELGVEAHCIAAWRDEFLDGGKEARKGREANTPDDRRIHASPNSRSAS